ncbi:ABC transporter substrate-binding protein [Clostridium frigidicarnis]|uniref:Spermidine/putrescine transport system substrate-binding protein n=1 Tax=Clostridium frigidicarnis TaxID=84698 RepID=A0A1I0VJL9_9CLOT|nr:spermidine/putrescine ABC transporter substrate-binding protein [Clostridium frigidicarnis]SFA76213.1 spermidine/putrescine transport system substrate-binding protein [Clostridium frigidicarnis]
MSKFKKLTSLVLITLLFTSLFSGCSNNSTGITLNFLNQGDYIDEELLEEFQMETGIKINYESFSTNEEMYQKLKSGVNQYDIVIPSEYMIQRLISDDMLEKLDFNNIPNIDNIDSKFKNLPHDPNNQYTAPYMWGTLGILYNSEMVTDPVEDWDILWNPKYKGEIFMVDSMRESLGVALQKLGYSLNSTNDNEIAAAKEELIKQKPLVRAYMVDETKERMAAEEGSLSVTWIGEAILAMERNSDLKYVIPDKSNIWIDAMCVPKGSTHKAEAEQLIDFLLEAEIGKQNAEYIGYPTANKAAYELLEDDVKNNKSAYPDASSLNHLEYFSDLRENLKKYDDAWLKVKSK